MVEGDYIGKGHYKSKLNNTNQSVHYIYKAIHNHRSDWLLRNGQLFQLRGQNKSIQTGSDQLYQLLLFVLISLTPLVPHATPHQIIPPACAQHVLQD